jgi:hypothetical protein
MFISGLVAIVDSILLGVFDKFRIGLSRTILNSLFTGEMTKID